MIRLLAVDDSPLMRRLLAEIFAAEGDFEARFARDGVEALAQLAQARADVVILDVQMPHMDGLACLDRIMLEQPCPVVMFSSLTEEGAKETLEALALGAVDFMPKPGGAVSLKLDEFGPALVEKVRAAAKAQPPRVHRLIERVRLRAGVEAGPRRRVRPPTPADRLTVLAPDTFAGDERLVLVGASTGGPPALDALLAPLPAIFPWPIVVAQHMPASFTGALARRLDQLCAAGVSEVTRPTPLAPGQVYIGRGDADVIVSRRAGELVALPAPSTPEHRWHPSVDRLTDSALRVMPAERLVGVLMTGMGFDGAAAMTRLRQGGGRTIAEAEETAVVWGMPGELVRAGGAEFVLPLGEIARRLLMLATQP
ncbi:MAG: chemotaxis-specific protein-glutamate methyltransferase CheB [Caulobacteraceae bacterium]|nr:chemotaxis-specific protein-glutamate methyltransferase CheB [Caulobacteraceae bacterium]